MPAPEAHDEFGDALARSAAVPSVSSPKPPLAQLSGGGPVAFSHRGDRMASPSGGGLVLWDTATWEAVKTIDVDGSLCDVIFSPDDRFVYVGGGGGGAIFARYETTTGRYEHNYSTGQSAMTSIVLSPGSGRTIAGQSLSEHQVLFHDTDSEKTRPSRGPLGLAREAGPRRPQRAGHPRPGRAGTSSPSEVDRGPP